MGANTSRRCGLPDSDKVALLQADYPDMRAIKTLCDFLTAAADGVHGRAAELSRHDDKRTTVEHAAISAPASHAGR